MEDCEFCNNKGFTEHIRRWGNKLYKMGEVYSMACHCRAGGLWLGAHQGSLKKIRQIDEIAASPKKKVAREGQFTEQVFWLDWPRNPKGWEEALDEGTLIMQVRKDLWYRAKRVKPTREAIPWVCYVKVGSWPVIPVTRPLLTRNLFRIVGTKFEPEKPKLPVRPRKRFVINIVEEGD